LAESEARTGYYKKRTAAAEQEDNSGLYDYAAGKKARDAAEKKLTKDISDTQKEIRTLTTQIEGKKLELSRANKAGIDATPIGTQLENLKTNLQDAEARMYRLGAGQPKPSSEEAREKWAAEAPAPRPETPADEVETVTLTPEDKAALEELFAARRDLSQDVILSWYLAKKRKGNIPKAPVKPAAGPAGGLREK
jgi:hypothetical protein